MLRLYGLWKLLTWGRDRDDGVQRTLTALSESVGYVRALHAVPRGPDFDVICGLTAYLAKEPDEMERLRQGDWQVVARAIDWNWHDAAEAIRDQLKEVYA